MMGHGSGWGPCYKVLGVLRVSEGFSGHDKRWGVVSRYFHIVVTERSLP